MNNGIYAKFNTNRGEILVNLEYEKTPGTVGNFVALAEGNLENDVKPQLLVCFTDGETWDQWGDADYCDTLWVIHTNDRVRPPFGQTVYYG